MIFIYTYLYYSTNGKYVQDFSPRNSRVLKIWYNTETNGPEGSKKLSKRTIISDYLSGTTLGAVLIYAYIAMIMQIICATLMLKVKPKVILKSSIENVLGERLIPLE